MGILVFYGILVICLLTDLAVCLSQEATVQQNAEATI